MPITQQRIANAFRGITNELEEDLAGQYVYASRAYGTAGTTPFSTADDLTDLTELRRILNDNGAPPTDRAVVFNSAAAAKLLGRQGSVFRVNEAGSSGPRQDGMLDNLFGFDLGESGQFKEHVASTGVAGVLVNMAGGVPIGTTAIPVDGAGAGETLVAGDLATLASDENNYVAAAAHAASFSTLNIGKPGLRQHAANNAAITMGGTDYTPTLGFSRDAIHLAARFPALPARGDMGEHMPIRDPYSGLMFELSYYPQYRQGSYEIGLCWGIKVTNPAHMALLLG